LVVTPEVVLCDALIAPCWAIAVPLSGPLPWQVAWLQVKLFLPAPDTGPGWQLAHDVCCEIRCRSMDGWPLPWQVVQVIEP